MVKIMAALFVTLLGGTGLLYIEYCWFDTKNCPFHVVSLTESDNIPPAVTMATVTNPVPSSLTESENIPPAVTVATVTNPVPSSDCGKTRLVNQQLVDDDCQPINPLRFKINYLYREGGQGDFRSFGEGSVLHSGDSLKLLFKPTEMAYVYIFMVDSHGNIGRLFPTADFKGASQVNRNPVQKGMQYFVPAPQKSFRLDRNTGEESIYFIATRQADAVLEQQYQQLFDAQQTKAVETIILIQEKIIVEFEKNEKQRLIEPELVTDVVSDEQPTAFEEAGQKFSVLPAYLNNLCEGCVYRVTFKHER